MKAKEFTELKKQVKSNNLKGLKGDTIQDLTITQAKAMEDILLDLELTAEGNKLLDAIVDHIEGVVAIEKVANKKAQQAPKEAQQAPKKEAPAPKAEQKKEAPKAEPKEPKEVNKIKVGDTVQFQVEGEEVIHGRTLKHKNTIRERQGIRKRRLLLGQGGPYYVDGGACLIVSTKLD